MLQPQEDVLIPSVCRWCHVGKCGILAHRVNGVVVGIRGDPTHPTNRGKLCAKAFGGIMKLYDPHRIKSPLVRTNPAKGIGVDPKWKQVSWEEALDLVASKLRKIREENPQELLFGEGDFHIRKMTPAWALAYGCNPDVDCMGGGSTKCGGNAHTLGEMMHEAFVKVPDYRHCNYLIMFGQGKGFDGGSSPGVTRTIREVADAMERGMKVVIVDPRCSIGASKAHEWLPVRPATDLALALAMLHVLVRENLYDQQFLKKHTNAAYLVGADEYYVRSESSGKPLVWDVASNAPKDYDSKDIQDPALNGEYEVNGSKCRPAFRVLKDRLEAYTPSWASNITTIPAETISRIAVEYGTAARIGSTINIDGVEYPYRPVAVDFWSGAANHVNGFQACQALFLLNIIVGNVDVPGGLLAVYSQIPHRVGADGTIEIAHDPLDELDKKFDLKALSPFGHKSLMTMITIAEGPENYGIHSRPKALFIRHNNPLLSIGDKEKISSMLRNFEFIAAFSLYMDETTEWADVVLPDCTYLERYDIAGPSGPDLFGDALRQPVIDRLHNTREPLDVYIDLAERMGFLYGFKGYNFYLNLALGFKPAYQLKLDVKYRAEEIYDRRLKSVNGDEYGLAYFREHGHKVGRKTPKEIYRPYAGRYRIPVYHESVKKWGDLLKGLTAERGLRWDTSAFTSLPEWRPAPPPAPESFDLYAILVRRVWHSFNEGQINPWFMELSRKDPYLTDIMINTRTAEKKGIKNGDQICVESTVGKVKGQAKLTQLIHPEVVGVGSFGSWATSPICKDVGVGHSQLLPMTKDDLDPPSGVLETTPRGKVYKAA